MHYLSSHLLASSRTTFYSCFKSHRQHLSSLQVCKPEAFLWNIPGVTPISALELVLMPKLH